MFLPLVIIVPILPKKHNHLSNLHGPNQIILTSAISVSQTLICSVKVFKFFL